MMELVNDPNFIALAMEHDTAETFWEAFRATPLGRDFERDDRGEEIRQAWTLLTLGLDIERQSLSLYNDRVGTCLTEVFGVPSIPSDDAARDALLSQYEILEEGAPDGTTYHMLRRSEPERLASWRIFSRPTPLGNVEVCATKITVRLMQRPPTLAAA